MEHRLGGGFILKVRDAGLYSACVGDTEFIDPCAPFGDFALRVDGERYDTGSETCIVTASPEGVATSCRMGPLQARKAFDIRQDGALRYTITLKNAGDKTADMDELSLRIALNSRFDWGVKGGERVIRHSFVAGDGSFVYCTPCDGHPPYIVLLPEAGTRLEMFDTHAKLFDEKDKERPAYRAFIHAAYEEGVARAKGCQWRQPVSKRRLEPGEIAQYAFAFHAARDYRHVRDLIYQNGQPDVEIIPGMTVPRHEKTLLRIRMRGDFTITSEYPDETTLRLVSRQGDTSIYEAVFNRLGENLLTLRWGEDAYSDLEFFVTLPPAELMEKRGAFIASHQHKGTGKWYEGLLAEHNNETGALLGPDNYDGIKGWRIYEVTCDDPGLSKPAFLSGKNAEMPRQAQVDALEYYIEHFVWGGLQRSGDEEYPYGIYGIPDWKTLRDKIDDIGVTGIAHIWRIYDYPHLALTYYNLYRIGAEHPQIKLKCSHLTYLDRAYRTFLALYTYPMELDEWSPYKTGLYNEMCVTGVMEALEREGRPLAAQRLRCHWRQKCKYFITACQDVFGSEYPFDTTGYESTQALAGEGLRVAAAWQPRHKHDKQPYTVAQARDFMDYQAQCNLACRGVMENAYHLLGSDYRNCSAHYTLSYMSQMGGQALLDYALRHMAQPFDMLRVAYASLLSSWALMNAGDAQGYWFPGGEHNGAAGGGFENAPYGFTWLEQPHHRGSWYYSCEIDLGYCGYLRGAACVLADDPLFGTVCYGGAMDGDAITPWDGVNRRFHYIAENMRVHVLVERANIARIQRLPDGKFGITLRHVRPGACIQIERDGESTTINVNERGESWTV